jgi:uncharacterized protein
MKISMHAMTAGSFVPMLESLSAILDKGSAHAKNSARDVMNARLAPDMYTLTRQVQLACDHAKDCVAALTGRAPPAFADDQRTLDDLKRRIASTVDYVNGAGAIAFEGAEERDCSISIPNNMVIAMNGLELLRSWSLPHFYFHLVTAYDILRHCGVAIGKQDYLSQVGAFIRPRP